jgi:phage terminase small subunit
VKMTDKINEFLWYYMESWNPATAAEKAGYAPRYGYEILKKLNAEDDFISLMDELCLTDVDVVMGLKEAKGATKPVWNSENKTFEIFPDYKTRLKATELIARLRRCFDIVVQIEDGMDLRDIERLLDVMGRKGILIK